MEHTYRFFVLRYVPDRDRGEQVNIGLVIEASPPVVRLSRDLRKATAIDARRDAREMIELEGRVRDWIAKTDDFDQAHEALRYFAPVTVSDFGWFTSTKGDYDATVDSLMHELITPPAKPPAKLRSRLNTGVRLLLEKNNVLSTDPEDIHRHKVIANYPISLRENLFADFALRNGSLQLNQTVDLRVTEQQVRGHKFNEVGLKALIAARSKKLHRGSKVYFVYAAHARQDPAISPHLTLMGEYSDGLFNFLSRQDRAAYLEKVLSAVQHDALPLKHSRQKLDRALAG